MGKKLKANKKKSKKKRSRYVKAEVAKKVDTKYGFKCAWDGIALTERHHIYEFSKGGENTESNLILLCPTCHTQVHNGEITEEDLLERKTAFKINDRIAGNLLLTTNDPIFKIGPIFYKNSRRLIVVLEKDIFTYNLKDGNLLMNARLYDKQGNLIFWMSSNRFWATVDFRVTTSDNEIEIKQNKGPIYLSLKKQNEFIAITGFFYIKSVSVELKNEMMEISGNSQKFPIYTTGDVIVRGGLFINSPNAADDEDLIEKGNIDIQVDKK